MNKSFRSLFLLIALIGSLFIYPIQPAYALAIPAEINKQFTPILIDAGGVSVLRITIFNPNTFALTAAAWTDNLVGVQPGLKIANPNGVISTCGGTVTAVPNTTTISLTGGNVPAQVGATPGECYVEINVTSTTAGNLINTIPIGNLNANGIDGVTPVTVSNTTPASATITVIAVTPPALSKGFAPNTIFVGQISQLTITINNNDADTNLTQTSYTDTLPANLVLATPVSPVVNNCGAYSLTAVANTNTIALSNATVTPAQDCTVTVNVISAVGGIYTNTIPAGPAGPGSIVTQQGVTNGGPASAPLNVQPVGLIKSFLPSPIIAGGTSTLTITLQNPTGANYTNVGITDNLPVGLTISGTPTVSQCGGTVSSTATSITLSGGVIPASLTPPTPVGTCTITATVQAGLTIAGGTLTNTIPPNSLTAAQPGVTNILQAQANLVVNPALTGTKGYAPTSIVINGVSMVTITLNNNSATNLTGVNFTDAMPANLNVSGTPVSPQCNGTITNAPTSVTLAGGSIPAGTSCTIIFDVTSSVAGSGTTYENTIPIGAITSTQGVGNTTIIRTGTDLTVINAVNLPVTVGKAFQTSPIVPGNPSRLRITITAPVDTNLTGLNISDTLPAGLVVIGIASVPAAPANPTDTCTAANVVAPIGGNTITLTGASILAGANCTITVYVTSTIPGAYNNMIPASNIVTTQGRTNVVDSNTATLVVTSMSMSKAFYPTSVQANGLSTLTITLQNTTTSPLINTQLTDTLPGTLTDGVVVAPIPNASTTCSGGVITAVPGSQTISMTGAVVPAQVGAVPGICTITITVQGKDSNATPSNRVNTIPTTNVSGTVQNTGVTINPIAQAQATLTTEPLTIGVVKGFNPVLVYGGAYSTMSVQLVNPNNADLTGITFTDNMALLGAGMQLANPVTFNVGTCGGALTGNPGDSAFSFSGGTLLANTSCTITLRVIMAVNGNLTNRIPAGAVTTFNGVSSTQPAEASLTNLPGASVTKSFNPSTILTGDYSALTITIQNTSNIPLLGMALTDLLPGALPNGLEIAGGAAPAPVNNCGGTFSAITGSQTIALSGGSLLGNASCTIVVSVTSSTPGTYVNTIPVGGLTATAGGSPVSNNNPTSDTLIVTAAEYSLGNRVWFDTDNSGTINGAEVGVTGVRVELYQDNGDGVYGAGDTFRSFTTTDANGYYRFDNLPAGNYVVVIPADNFRNVGVGDTVAGDPLSRYWSSETTISGAGVISDSTANDPDTTVTDSDDNGRTTFNGNAINYVASAAVTLGPGTAEPINESDLSASGQGSLDNRADMTVDFGFYQVALGNQVFIDVDSSGAYNAGDSALPGATVQLFASNGTTEINVGPDGILGTSDDAAGGVLTGVGGTYLFSGLPGGDYIVKVTPPVGYSSTVDTADSTDTTNPNTNTNNNDNGVGTSAGQTSSNIVTLTPGNLGAASNNVVTNSTGITSNPTVDFGFVSLNYSLGNRVWFDTDNSGTINGTELGISGVRVELYQDNGDGVYGAGDIFQSFATTDANGYYRFDNLPAGDYVVVIPADNFRNIGAGDTVAGDPLSGYWSSGTVISGAGAVSDSTANDPDTTVTDSDDNGRTTFTGSTVNDVASAAVTLGPGTGEPTNELDVSATGQGTTDNRADMTVDFGFYRVALGNQVFIDVDNSGTYNAGDTNLSGATVQLYASNGTTEINVGPDGILGTSDDAAGGVLTGAGGTYLFSGLPGGDYIVKVTPPVGYSSTVDTADSTDTTNPNTNTNNNDNGVGTAGGQAVSNLVTLTPGSVGAATNNIVNNAAGTTTNPTVDFGFTSANILAKTIIDTDQIFTSGNNVAIGEIVTYQVIINLPVGTPLNNVTVTDVMDKGLAYVDCLSVIVGGNNLTNTVCPSAVVSAITDPGDLVLNPANPGRQVIFNIGNIPAPIAASTIVIQYRAIVLDVIENQDALNLGNSVTWAWNGGSLSTSAPDVKIVEPDVAIDKSAAPTTVTTGTIVQFTLVINHTAPSTADAFDVEVSDVLPAGLEYIPCTPITYTGLVPTTQPNVCNLPGGNALTFAWDSFPLNQSATIVFFARFDGTQPSVINLSSVVWTSLPIDPGQGGIPVQLSTFNSSSTERRYDPLDTINVYQVSDTVTLSAFGNGDDAEKVVLPKQLPSTGFAPGKITILKNQPAEKKYVTTDVWMEIPSLGVNVSIVGIPLIDDAWDLAWLEEQAGWLNGTAFPGWDGNSVLTAHVYLPNGKPGPFVELGKLKWGSKIIVHAYGSVYTYEVRQNRTVSPQNTSILNHEDSAWLTLITCKTYNEKTNTYANRVAVRAVLVSVQKEKQEKTPKGER